MLIRDGTWVVTRRGMPGALSFFNPHVLALGSYIFIQAACLYCFCKAAWLGFSSCQSCSRPIRKWPLRLADWKYPASIHGVPSHPPMTKWVLPSFSLQNSMFVVQDIMCHLHCVRHVRPQQFVQNMLWHTPNTYRFRSNRQRTSASLFPQESFETFLFKPHSMV